MNSQWQWMYGANGLSRFGLSVKMERTGMLAGSGIYNFLLEYPGLLLASLERIVFGLGEVSRSILDNNNLV